MSELRQRLLEAAEAAAALANRAGRLRVVGYGWLE